MRKFIIKRLLYLLPLLFFVSVFIFLVLRLSGTDAALNYLHVSGIVINDENIENARAYLGLDKPILEQYITWIKKAITFDFGTSYLTKRPIAQDFLLYLPQTLKLTGFALLLTIALSLPLGVLSAIYKDRFFDYFVRVFAFLGVSTPNFWFAILLILFFSVQLKILPPFGAGSINHLIMPALAISFMSIAINARLIRANFLEVKNERFINYAKIRGVSKFKIYMKHIFSNTLLPIVTVIGMHIGELIGGALIVENIFAYPGIGRYAVAAISNNDYPVTQAFILMMSFIFIILNLIIDIVYAAIDPRIRSEHA